MELCVLGKREIENYLLNSRALSQYIGKRVAAENKQIEEKHVSAEQIEKHLDECAEGLKELALYKRLGTKACRPNFSELTSRHEADYPTNVEEVDKDFEKRIALLQAKRDEVPKTVERISLELEKAWAGGRLDIVPGEELLGKVFARYGLAYRKERDGVGLAGSLRPDEVHGDLKRIIQQTCGV